MTPPLMPSSRPSIVVAAAVALGLAAASGVGCSSSSTDKQPPVIDELVMADTATMSSSDKTVFQVSGTISAHDPDGVIEKAVIYSPPAEPFEEDLAGPSVKPSFSKAPFIVRFTNPQSGTTVSYEVGVFDNDGLESGRVQKTAKIP